MKLNLPQLKIKVPQNTAVLSLEFDFMAWGIKWDKIAYALLKAGCFSTISITKKIKFYNKSLKNCMLLLVAYDLPSGFDVVLFIDTNGVNKGSIAFEYFDQKFGIELTKK